MLFLSKTSHLFRTGFSFFPVHASDRKGGMGCVRFLIILYNQLRVKNGFDPYGLLLLDPFIGTSKLS